MTIFTVISQKGYYSLHHQTEKGLFYYHFPPIKILSVTSPKWERTIITAIFQKGFYVLDHPTEKELFLL